MLALVLLLSQVWTREGLDSLLATRFDAGQPGSAIAVVDGSRLVTAARGIADVAAATALTEQHNFYLASVTKPFTALVVHGLVREGTLRYADRVVDRIPELAATDSTITLEHLLTHASGLADFYSFIDWPRFRRLDNAAVLDTLRAHARPVHSPGSRYEYSNSNYVLLALVAERAAGRSLGTLLQERVFTPAGMRHATLYDDSTRVVPARTRAYQRSGERFLLSDIDGLELPDGRRIPYRFLQTGQGGLFASASDMGAWMRSMLDGTLLDSEEQEMLFRVRREAPGQPGLEAVRGVAYGWFVSERHGARIVWHDGARGGSRAAVALVPERGLGVAVLSNAGTTDALALAGAILDRMLVPNAGGR